MHRSSSNPIPGDGRLSGERRRLWRHRVAAAACPVVSAAAAAVVISTVLSRPALHVYAQTAIGAAGIGNAVVGCVGAAVVTVVTRPAGQSRFVSVAAWFLLAAPIYLLAMSLFLWFLPASTFPKG